MGEVEGEGTTLKAGFSAGKSLSRFTPIWCGWRVVGRPYTLSHSITSCACTATAHVVSPAPVASPVADCVAGPGRAAAKACPATAPHVCYAGPAKGGCARAPWSRTDCARSCKRPKGFD